MYTSTNTTVHKITFKISVSLFIVVKLCLEGIFECNRKSYCLEIQKIKVPMNSATYLHLLYCIKNIQGCSGKTIQCIGQLHQRYLARSFRHCEIFRALLLITFFFTFFFALGPGKRRCSRLGDQLSQCGYRLFQEHQADDHRWRCLVSSGGKT